MHHNSNRGHCTAASPFGSTVGSVRATKCSAELQEAEPQSLVGNMLIVAFEETHATPEGKIGGERRPRVGVAQPCGLKLLYFSSDTIKED